MDDDLLFIITLAQTKKHYLCVVVGTWDEVEKWIKLILLC
jgi:hypothetical protein